MCDFYLSFLDLNFIKKSLLDKRFYFWETFDFWNLEVLKLTFKILRLWNLKTLNLKFGAWNLKFWDLEFWKLRLEIFIMKFGVWIFLEILKIEDLDFFYLGMKILNWNFGVWKILENFECNFFFFFGWVLSVGTETLAPHIFVSLFSFFLLHLFFLH